MLDVHDWLESHKVPNTVITQTNSIMGLRGGQRPPNRLNIPILDMLTVWRDDVIGVGLVVEVIDPNFSNFMLG